MIYPEQGIHRFVEICFRKGISTIVISPGSRNAPIINAFSDFPEMNCVSIVDERSAAFFALGMAQQTGKTIALACTSGSAPLNFAPAIAEAYYQKIPLLVLTADRPGEWVDQSDNQTIRQQNVYANYINSSFQLPQNISSEDDLWYYERITCEAIDLCNFPQKGPVHINMPFTEPLYKLSKTNNSNPKIINTLRPTNSLDKDSCEHLMQKWNKYAKKLIVCGMHNPDEKLNALLSGISKNSGAVVITETNSNLVSDDYFSGIDKILSAVPTNQSENLQPELLITFSGQVISKKIKTFLRKYKAIEHWHIDASELFIDTYQSLTLNIPLQPIEFFELISKFDNTNSNSSYIEKWNEIRHKANSSHKKFLQDCEYSDLKAFEVILDAIPEGSNLHLGNSTPVRYAQLFDANADIKYNCNRGTSGIDGTVSTAAGAAFANKTPTTLITGDLSFFYDSNGLWNHHLDKNLRIIIINNQGGGIFRFIEGPSETKVLDEFFETKHNTKADGIASSYGLAYFTANNPENLESVLKEFYHSDNNSPSILEVFTPREINGDVLKSYFKHFSESE